jgi:hypothetical protein
LQLRFRRAFMALLGDDRKLSEFGKLWAKDRAQAATSVGITPNDLATLYAFFRVGDQQAMEGIRNGRSVLNEILSNERTLAVRLGDNTKKLQDALALLLNPETLSKFMAQWPNDPRGALQLVGLEPEDAKGFYEHLAEKGVNLDWPLWL